MTPAPVAAAKNTNTAVEGEGRDGTIYIDFDARTGHNHGTKFRMKQGYWNSIYSMVEKIMRIEPENIYWQD